MTSMNRILMTGASGQIGTELLKALRRKHGGSNVVATDIQALTSAELRDSGPFEFLRRHRRQAARRADRRGIGSTRSTTWRPSSRPPAKRTPSWPGTSTSTARITSWRAAREHKLIRVFIPSSIAAFGPETPRRKHAPGDHPPAQDHVRRDQGRRRASGRLLCPALRRRCPRLPLPRHHQPRDPARRRDDGLRRGHLLRSRQEQALHLLPARGHAACR